MPEFDDLGIPSGFLTDGQIHAALKNEQLIVPGSWDDECIRHASYTLRLGHKVEVARADRANEEDHRDFAVRDLKDGDYFDLEPGDTAKLYSIEILRMPDSVLGFTVARGLMFFEALVPENTYVDPGFNGSLYTTVINLSNRRVRLHYGDPIARLFFFNLSEPVQESYRQGAAKGLKQRLDSFRSTKYGTALECSSAKTKDLQEELPRIPTAGNQIFELSKRQNRKWVGLLVFSISWPTLLVIANTYPAVSKEVGWVLRNVGAFLISSLISFLAPKVWSKVQRL